MKLLKPISIVAVMAVFAVLIGCSDESTPTAPGPVVGAGTGILSVAVIDQSLNQPVENVDITIPEAHLTETTDANGKAVFRLAPGTYYVDAQVCCIGPGWIEHHVEVVVTAGHRVTVTLNACLSCV